MSEFRRDPVTGHWIIVAPARSQRPIDFRVAAEEPVKAQACPFCAGNESLTPPAIATYRTAPADPASWQVRVVPNLYAAVSIDAPSNEFSFNLDCQSALGQHYVVVESPQHIRSITELSQRETANVVFAYRDLYRRAKKNNSLRFAILFKNSGVEAGASRTHLHSQFVALPFIPPLIQAELDGARKFLIQQNGCVFCEMLRNELDTADRMVLSSKHFVAFCPYASKIPYEICIVPRQHVARIESVSDDALDDLATVLTTIVNSYERELPKIDYNYFIHSAPFDTSADISYHWHIELFPRTIKFAGFECGTGCSINAVSPEHAATVLRVITGQ